MNKFFKSIIDEDKMAIVICDLNHTIIYMNPAAINNYQKRGGSELLGKSLMNCHNEHSRVVIEKIVEWFKEDKDHNRMFTYYNAKKNYDVYMIALRDEDDDLIGYYEKHESRIKEESEGYHG